MSGDERTYQDLIHELLPGFPELQKIVELTVEDYSKTYDSIISDPEEKKRLKIAYAGGICSGFIFARNSLNIQSTYEIEIFSENGYEDTSEIIRICGKGIPDLIENLIHSISGEAEDLGIDEDFIWYLEGLKIKLIQPSDDKAGDA